MLSIESMRLLHEGYKHYSDYSLHQAMADIGSPTNDEILASALALVQSADRNERVLALRILAHQDSKEAMLAVLQCLSDPKRRVRQVATASARAYIHQPEIVARLQEMTLDEAEKLKIREHALQTLSLLHEQSCPELPVPVTEALSELAQGEAHRTSILQALVRLELSDGVKQLLEAYVEGGTREEAIMATRALAGQRVIHFGAFEGDSAVQRYLKEHCEIAYGRVWHWIDRQEFVQLKAEYDARNAKE